MSSTLQAPLLTARQLAQLQSQARYWRGRLQPGGAIHGGPRKSPWRGQGLELEDTRPYCPGDDIRYMAWRATARTGRPTMGVFREERNRTLYLLVQRSPSMVFASRGELKATAAARVTALVAFAAHAAQERVSAVRVGESGPDFPPARSEAGVLALVQAFAAPFSAAQTQPHWPTVLARLVRTAEPHAGICLIGDLEHLDTASRGLLRHLSIRHAVAAVQIVDPAEESLPATGPLRLSAADGQTYVVDSDDPVLRARYAAAMAHRQADLARLCRDSAVSLTRVYTHWPIAEQLMEVLP